MGMGVGGKEFSWSFCFSKIAKHGDDVSFAIAISGQTIIALFKDCLLKIIIEGDLMIKSMLMVRGNYPAEEVKTSCEILHISC